MDATRLSPREHEALHLVVGGATTSTIAARLGVMPRTVDAFVGSAMRKLGARTRLQAAATLARDRGSASGPRGTVPRLSPPERELLGLLASGETVTRAASLVGLSRRSAVRHLLLLRQAADVDSVIELVVLVEAEGTGRPPVHTSLSSPPPVPRP